MKYPTTFAIFTVALMLITGVFIYITRFEEAATMSHVPDPDWSRPRVVTPSLNTINAKKFAVDAGGRGYVFWGVLNSDGERPELQYQIVGSNGKVVQKPQRILNGIGSWEFAVTIQQERIHLFWMGQGTGEKLDLHYSQFDLQGTLLEDQIVKDNLFLGPNDLQVAGAPNGQFMLTWLDQEDKRVQGAHNLQTLLIKADGTASGNPYEVASFDNDNYLPNIVADAKGRFHLAWIQELRGKSKLFTTREIYYQGFDSEGVAIAKPQFIDETAPDRVGIAVKDDTVYLAWNKVVYVTQKQRKQAADTIFDNFVIFGGALDVNHPETLLQSKRLTPEIGPFFDQNLIIDAQGQIQMVFVAQYRNFIALTHSIYDENLEMIKQPKRVYPEQRLDNLGVTASIFPDTEKGIHVFWEDGSSHGKMFYYYANTKQHRQVSPLQVIGLNTNNLIISSVVSLGYTFIMPFINVIFNLIFFAVFFVALCWRGVAEALKRLGIHWALENPYVGPTITVIGLLTIYSKVGMWPAFFTSHNPTGLDTAFLMITATVACALYLWINRTKEGTLTVCIATATLWAFWVNMMSQVFTLPGWNYFMSV